MRGYVLRVPFVTTAQFERVMSALDRIAAEQDDEHCEATA